VKPEIVLACCDYARQNDYAACCGETGYSLTADCTGLDIDPLDRSLLQTRPAIGGNVMATIKTPASRPQMATVKAEVNKASFCR